MKSAATKGLSLKFENLFGIDFDFEIEHLELKKEMCNFFFNI